MKQYKNYTILLLFGLLMSCNFNAFSQEQKPPSEFWRHVRFGGGIGLSFGDGFFSGTLAPSAIYQFDHRFAMGVALNGTYNSQRNTYSSTILGGSVLSLFNVIPQIQLSAEFEQLNVNRSYDSRLGFANENYWYPALFLGAGFRSNNVTVGIRYDVLYDSRKSIYANAYMPFFRVYF
jgi:hypothetical protein